MAAPTTRRVDHQTPLIDKALAHGDSVAASTAKADCERGAVGRELLSKSSQTTATYRKLWSLAGILSLAFLVQSFVPAVIHSILHEPDSESVVILDDLCPQVEALTSPRYEALLGSLDEEFGTTEFKTKAYESLGGAVRIPTESYNDFGPPSEYPRWETEAKFHEYLESRFPKVHANLKRTKVATYALVFEWKGTETLKPLMLTGHIDVVPANPATYNDWINPPYSGFYDGAWIWGRGSCGDRSGVIGIFTTIETLLERGFVPSRMILLAFGIDEERGGKTGARAIARYLLGTYGADSLAMAVSEGGQYEDLNGTVFAMPVVAEKGYIDIQMDVLTPGGHSAVPPKHTGIGILANIITELEAHPHEPELVRGRTYYQGLECRAKYDTGFPASLSKLVRQSQTSDRKLRELGDRLMEFDPMFYAMTTTTQAISLVGGDVRANALPKVAWAVANYRIADHSSLAELIGRLANITLPISAKHNMTLEVFGKTVGSQGPSWGTIRLYDAFDHVVVPTPVTPTTGSGPYALLSGTIRSTLQTHLRANELPRTTVVTPVLAIGNTDARYYSNLTKHILRYSHVAIGDCRGARTINEAIRGEGFLEYIRFLTRLILNADQSDLLE